MNKTALAISTVLPAALLIWTECPMWAVALAGTSWLWGVLAAGVADQLIEQAKKLLTLSK